MKRQLDKVLDEEYGLRIKYDWQVFRFDYIDESDGRRKGRPLDFVGFQFYHDKITIRKRTYKKIKKLINSGKWRILIDICCLKLYNIYNIIRKRERFAEL